jgi:hypothetical protein
MQSPGMLQRVAFVGSDFSEKHIASIIKVANIGELGKMLVVTSNRCTLRRNIISGYFQDASVASYC